MRKTAALAVLVLLIGFAALAPGQSVDRGRRGWVAWQRNEVRGGNTDWVALVAVESLDTCREVAQHDAASMFRDLQVRKEVRGVPVAAVSYNGVSIDIEFPDGRHSTVSNTCLPQTAIDLPLGRRDMERALALARWPHSDAERERFHRQYLVGVNGPTVENWAVEQVEVITEFRRLELIAEEHARVNDMFGRAGVQEAEQALRPWLGRLSIVADLGLRASKPYVGGVPDVNVTLEGPGTVSPIDIHRAGLYATCGSYSGCPLVGARVEALFDARRVGPSARTVSVTWNGRELARATIDFAQIE